MVASIPRPSLPRIVPLPGGAPAVELPTFSDLSEGEAQVDEFGLAAGIYGNYPREQRRLVAIMLRTVGGDKRARPPLGATIPEAIMFGLLIDNGHTWTNSPTIFQNQFRFQSYELGGRQPGGAVTDFYLNVNGTRIACRVNGAYHDLRSPFGDGAQKKATDLRLQKTLLASRFIDTVVDVNEAPERVLETSGNPSRVYREYLRVIGRAV